MTNTIEQYTPKIGDEVEGGEGDDMDHGVIHQIEGDRAYVGWESGVSTWTPLADLRPRS